MGNKFNEFHPHSGRYCYGKTPMQTFLDSKHIAIDKSCVHYWGNLTVRVILQKLSIKWRLLDEA